MTGDGRATRRRWWPWTLGAAVVALAVFGGYAVFAKVVPGPADASRRAGPPSVGIPVVAAHACVADTGVYLTGLGTVTALNTVTVPRFIGAPACL